MREVVESTLGRGRGRLAREAEGGEVGTGRSGLSTCKADTRAIVRVVNAPARGECLAAGLVSEAREVFLGLSMRDDEEQPQEFAVNASAGGHNCGKKSLGSIGAVGPVIVVPVFVDFSHGFAVEEGRRGGVWVGKSAVAADILHDVAMKFVDYRDVDDQVLSPGELDAPDEEVGASLSTACGDLSDRRGIAGTVTNRL